MNTILSAIPRSVFFLLFLVVDLILLSEYIKNWKKTDIFGHVIYLVSIFFMFPMLIVTRYCVDEPGISEGTLTLVYVLLVISLVALLVPLFWNFALKWKRGEVPEGRKRAFLIYITVFGTLFLIGLIISLFEK